MTGRATGRTEPLVSLLAVLGVIGGAALLGGCGGGDPVTTTSVGELLALEADTGVLTAVGTGDAATYTLALSGLDQQMAVFADRPLRQGTLMPVSDLVDLWKQGGTDSFTAHPPNAAITTHTASGELHIGVGTLTDPAYDPATGTLTVTVTFIGAPLPDHNLGNTSLLIDNAPVIVGQGPPMPTGFPPFPTQSLFPTGFPVPSLPPQPID